MRRMLIVEDEQDVCKGLQKFFGARQFEVATAFSGEEALARLREGRIDVLLIDILLPGIHGIEVLRTARKLHPAARIIVISGFDEERIQDDARRAGADEFIKKPFDLSERTWSSVLQPA